MDGQVLLFPYLIFADVICGPVNECAYREILCQCPEPNFALDQNSMIPLIWGAI